MTLLVYQIIQMLSPIEEIFNILILILVRYWVAEALIDACLVILFDHTRPKDTPIGHILACLHIENCCNPSLLQS